MADAPTLSPEVSRSVSALARTLVAAARSWALYPPDHPAVRGSLERLRVSIGETTHGKIFAFGVTPDTLLIAGIAVGGRDAGAIAEAARWLHERDILQLTFAGDVTVHGLQRLLGMLSEDSRVIRRRGGPAKVWTEEGDVAIAVEQIDFSQVLEDREVANPVRRKDDLWRAIIRGILDRKKPTDEAAQARLLEISKDVMAISELANDVIAPHHTMDGSPMLTSQAAAVVAAYHYLVGIVDVLSPERKQEVMQNLATATCSLNPHVVMQMLTGGGPGDAAAGTIGEAGSGAVVAGIIDAMDDDRVAQLLATTLAIEGQASERLATVFNTIATDDDRKSRVLSLTRRMLSETDFGRQDAFQSLWSSMEELLLTYNEKPFVGASYRAAMDQVGSRAEQMASDVPADLVEMLETLGQDNVRRLSVRLLIDLLTLEKDPARGPELARDVAALSEDLLLAGDYGCSALGPGGGTRRPSPVKGGPSLDGVVRPRRLSDREAPGRHGRGRSRRRGHLRADRRRDRRWVHLEPGRAKWGGRARGGLIPAGARAPSSARLGRRLGRWAAQRASADPLGRMRHGQASPLPSRSARAGPRVRAVRRCAHQGSGGGAGGPYGAARGLRRPAPRGGRGAGGAARRARRPRAGADPRGERPVQRRSRDRARRPRRARSRR